MTAPVLTIPTMIEVVVDELWNNVVANIPTNKEIKGLLVVVIIWFAKSPPKSLIPLERPLIPTRNRYKAKTTPSILNIILKFLLLFILIFFCLELYNVILNIIYYVLIS